MHRKIIPYENISAVASSKAITQAEEILSQGWVRRGHIALDLYSPMPWKLENENVRSWNYHLHCWEMIDSLLKAYSLTEDTRYLTPSIGIALDWIKHNEGDKQVISPFAWYDMSVGMRSYRLAYIIDASEKSKLLSVSERDVLWACLLEHDRYLMDDKNISFHNNHGYYQVAGQIAMARRFASRFSDFLLTHNTATKRLKIILDQQFAPDGIHREHSPDYHRMVYTTLRALIDAGLVEDEEVHRFAIEIENALSWFVLPNKRIANFGDSDYRSMERGPRAASTMWRSEEMRYLVTDGEIGTAPKELYKVFDQGGYFVVRHPSTDAPTDLSRASYLAQIAAFHSRTHKHADDLSFIWSDRGADLLVDAGRYGYVGKTAQGSDLWLDGHWYSDPNRVYCESTRAHNTLEFNGTNNLRKGVKPYGSAITRHNISDGIFSVETECKLFQSIRRARVLVFKPAEWLLVFDWFHDNYKEAHDVRQWFHLAPNLDLEITDDGYQINISSSSTPLQVASLLGDASPSRLYIGEEEPKQGWWSGKEKEWLPNYAFCYELKGKMTGSFATLFSFSKGLSARRDLSRINSSGRNGRFAWETDDATHSLEVTRTDGGRLSVVYAKV